MSQTYPNNVSSFQGNGGVNASPPYIEISAASTTLTVAQSGSIIGVNIAATTMAIFLPVPTYCPGCTFTFIFLNAKATNTGTCSIRAITTSSAHMIGNFLTTSGPAGTCVFTSNSTAKIETVASQCGEGDRIVAICDGTLWQVVGQFGSSTAGAVFN